ncbi:(2S)-methylsuccinyl-CoA dehydrogenase [Methylopila jiangsuensis]|uniref:(2S)-methylsuccinyl-CoA dehydrogenase n=1 Tax=Methylopila jiangsuensis TaxID=586230 RepID=A0A9W6N322_9HYPH|nr:acyl-CoA dehydrogenase family protein [Methylopila jiangsuensis]MDR6287082.1 (2S)-methylsuccinyl-CoA dehydrogenase [Methylopila jiangsuensis]GLK76569.1 (2S)-methylsuccinyl-CoA dehydrogenase [Methylopila jiangsuensis]
MTALAQSAAPESVAATAQLSAVLPALDTLLAEAASAVRAKVVKDGKIDSAALDREQRATHGLAWLATYRMALRELAHWGERLGAEGKFGAIEEAILRVGAAEYLAQIIGGIPMNQGETVRARDLGLAPDRPEELLGQTAQDIIADGGSPEARHELAELIRKADGRYGFGDPALDETLVQFRDEMHRFAEAEVAPYAHAWHLANAYIPLETIQKMAELGVFGLTIPEEFGGLGLGKEAMCVVSEELSRAYIGVGSLGTRSEIAAELIMGGGTEEQKAHFLPKLADGSILPTAVFTEPNTGSDLASLKTRAARDGDVYKVNGAKTWITHPVRADLMTLLVRTNPNEPGHRGLSMLLAEKPRGTEADPFPAPGMSGGEIEVLGYRGMKEFEIGFDGFEVPAANLLGGVEGEGFKQLMKTFESARIQTAARAVGVAQSALDIGLRYAEERIQFKKPLADFPRVADKLVMMAVEVQIARQITYFAAREKDLDRRCDLEAGMAKLLAARVAWAAADNALQIHGGNGFALEYQISRVLCDARILNIFEGAGEIQAQVIARRLLEQAA